MATDILYLDGVDVSTYGMHITGMPDAFGAPAAGWDIGTVPQYDGGRLLRDRPTLGPRTIEFSALIIADDADDLEDAVQSLKDTFWGRPVEIRYGHQSGYAFTGVLQAFNCGLFAPTNLNGWASATLSFLLPDPYAVDTTDTTETETPIAAIEVEVGTGPTYCVVTITGAATDPTLTYRDKDGNVIGTMAFSVTLTGDDALIVDATDGGSVTLDEDGTLSDGLALLASGYDFPIFRPEHANRGASDWPTVEVSSGAALSVSYRKRWI